MQGDGAGTIGIAGFVFDPRIQKLRDRSGARVALRPQTLAVAHCLACRPDRLVPRDDLMRAVWPAVVVTDHSLAQCIKEIRHALNDSGHRIVSTEPKRGYRLAGRLPAAPVRARLVPVRRCRGGGPAMKAAGRGTTIITG